MNAELLYEALSDRHSLEQLNRQELEKLVSMYPYFSIGQLLLAKKQRSENQSDSYQKQREHLQTFYRNPWWLFYQLELNDVQVRSKRNGTQEFRGIWPSLDEVTPEPAPEPPAPSAEPSAQTISAESSAQAPSAEPSAPTSSAESSAPAPEAVATEPVPAEPVAVEPIVTEPSTPTFEPIHTEPAPIANESPVRAQEPEETSPYAPVPAPFSIHQTSEDTHIQDTYEPTRGIAPGLGSRPEGIHAMATQAVSHASPKESVEPYMPWSNIEEEEEIPTLMGAHTEEIAHEAEQIADPADEPAEEEEPAFLGEEPLEEEATVAEEPIAAEDTQAGPETHTEPIAAEDTHTGSIASFGDQVPVMLTSSEVPSQVCEEQAQEDQATSALKEMQISSGQELSQAELEEFDPLVLPYMITSAMPYQDDSPQPEAWDVHTQPHAASQHLETQHSVSEIPVGALEATYAGQAGAGDILYAEPAHHEPEAETSAQEEIHTGTAAQEEIQAETAATVGPDLVQIQEETIEVAENSGLEPDDDPRREPDGIGGDPDDTDGDPDDTDGEPDHTDEPSKGAQQEPPALPFTINMTPLNQDFAFEPLHTVDYFASQGIKVDDAANEGSDKFSKNLKSFTEWLRSMKRINPMDRLHDELDTATEAEILHLAAGANHQKEAIVTESMAQVWVHQGKILKAIEVYNKLSLQHPEKRAYFAAKIEQLNRL
jgi:hypothetical protein